MNSSLSPPFLLMSTLQTDSTLQMYYHRPVKRRPRGKHFSKDSFKRTFCNIFNTKASPEINQVAAIYSSKRCARCLHWLFCGSSASPTPAVLAFRELRWGLAPCLAQGGDAHGEAGLAPGGQSQSSWLCFTKSPPKHTTQP